MLAVFPELLPIQENERICSMWIFSSVVESSLETFRKDACEESSRQSTVQYFDSCI